MDYSIFIFVGFLLLNKEVLGVDLEFTASSGGEIS